MRLALATVFILAALLPAAAQSCYPGFHRACKPRLEDCTVKQICEGTSCRTERTCVPVSSPQEDCYCTKDGE